MGLARWLQRGNAVAGLAWCARTAEEISRGSASDRAGRPLSWPTPEYDVPVCERHRAEAVEMV